MKEIADKFRNQITTVREKIVCRAITSPPIAFHQIPCQHVAPASSPHMSQIRTRRSSFSALVLYFFAHFYRLRWQVRRDFYLNLFKNIQLFHFIFDTFQQGAKRKLIIIFCNILKDRHPETNFN